MELDDQELLKWEQTFSLEEEYDIDLLGELFQEVFKEFGDRRSRFVANENILLFKHGANWSGYTKEENSSERWNSSFQKQSASAGVAWDDFLTANFSRIEDFKDELVKSLSDSFESQFFKTIEEATKDQIPIELKLSGDIRPAILKMWQEIHLGLNDDLTLSLPSMALDSESFEKLANIREELEQDIDFKNKLERLKLKKWLDALLAHFQNLLKYHLHDEERRNIEHQLRRLRGLAEAALCKDGCDVNSRELVEGEIAV